VYIGEEFISLYVGEVSDDYLSFIVSVVCECETYVYVAVTFSADVVDNFEAVASESFVDGFESGKVQNVQMLQTGKDNASP
jgi:hypothetical protein